MTVFTAVYVGSTVGAALFDCVTHTYLEGEGRRRVPVWVVAVAWTAATVQAGSYAWIVPGLVLSLAVMAVLELVMPRSFGMADQLLLGAAAMHHPYLFHRTALLTVVIGAAYMYATKQVSDDAVPFTPVIAAAVMTTTVVL